MSRAGQPPPPTRFGAPVVQQRRAAGPTGIAAPPTRFGPAVAQQQPAAVRETPGHAARPVPAVLQRAKALEKTSESASSAPDAPTLVARAKRDLPASKVDKAHHYEICNGGFELRVTIENRSGNTWQIGIVQAITYYSGKEIYQHKTNCYTLKNLPIKDANLNTPFYMVDTIYNGQTKVMVFNDSPTAYPRKTIDGHGDLVRVERCQQFYLWAVAKRGVDVRVLKKYFWAVHSSCNVATGAFTGIDYQMAALRPDLSEIMAQRRSANRGEELEAETVDNS